MGTIIALKGIIVGRKFLFLKLIIVAMKSRIKAVKSISFSYFFLFENLNFSSIFLVRFIITAYHTKFIKSIKNYPLVILKLKMYFGYFKMSLGYFFSNHGYF